MAAAVSPSSSPRLPSPPPIAEDQVGPTSPGLPLFDDHGKFPVLGGLDTGASRRIRPGTRSEDMAEGPPVVELQDIDSAFQLTEHLKALHHAFTHPSDSETVQPVTAEVARQLTEPPANTSRDIWLYELGRFLIQKTNAIIISLFADQPPCSAQTCPEMRASEWQYLCAVHDPPKSCAAIDYCCHTLDQAATTLTSSKMFPSRLGLGSGSGTTVASDKVLQQQMKEIKNIFRRVYRIYAHAWFQHREMFWRVESKTGLYVFFKMVCDQYGIIESENYTIPPEAEGAEPSTPLTQLRPHGPTILRKDHEMPPSIKAEELPEPAHPNAIAQSETTKRHRHTLSDRPTSVATVIQEEAEEEEDNLPVPQKLGRTGTVLKSPTEPLTTTTEVYDEDDDDDVPEPGLSRSDTMKASQEGQMEEEDPQDETVIEVKEDELEEGELKEEEEQLSTPAVPSYLGEADEKGS